MLTDREREAERETVTDRDRGGQRQGRADRQADRGLSTSQLGTQSRQLRGQPGEQRTGKLVTVTARAAGAARVPGQEVMTSGERSAAGGS